jgi:hypothetical protein
MPHERLAQHLTAKAGTLHSTNNTQPKSAKAEEFFATLGEA